MRYTKEDLVAYKIQLNEFNKHVGKLDARVGEIIKLIWRAFGSELGKWGYNNAEDDDIGSIHKYTIEKLIEDGEDTDEEINYRGMGTLNETLRHGITDDGLNYRLPAKWIFWEDEKITKWILGANERREKRSQRRKS